MRYTVICIKKMQLYQGGKIFTFETGNIYDIYKIHPYHIDVEYRIQYDGITFLAIPYDFIKLFFKSIENAEQL